MKEYLPPISVVVTTYQRPFEAKRAILSVLAQTYQPLEVIVVEDHGTSTIGDWVRKVATSFQNSISMQFIRHDENKGLAAARNTGLEAVTGDYVAFLDDDDEWKERRLEAQIEALYDLQLMQREKVAVIYCGIELRFVDTGATIEAMPRNSGNLAESIKVTGLATLSSTCLFRVSALRAVGGYDSDLKSSIDHDIWMALAAGGYDVLPVKQALVIVRRRRRVKQMMRDTSQRLEGVLQFLDKWELTFSEWEENGIFIDHYFSRVITRLIAAKVFDGQFGEAMTAMTAIYQKCDDLTYATNELVYALSREVSYRLSPGDAVTRTRNAYYVVSSKVGSSRLRLWKTKKGHRQSKSSPK
jgi:glycosyltransferase involved in cell wall biosynthesis